MAQAAAWKKMALAEPGSMFGFAAFTSSGGTQSLTSTTSLM
jgi:hypothetical protein